MDSMQLNQKESPSHSVLLLVLAISLTASAAGMGWGIRGQYGHETGAMIAGTLASLTLVMLFVPNATTLGAARAAAMMTVAIGIGGQMTYGQTVGLTHDAEVVGNWEALRWGMLGLAVKGGIWIGFSTTFLGMGLGGVRYGFWEMIALFAALIGVMFFGVWLLNSPYDTANGQLPWIYFSDDWYFEPGRDLKPRRETWGGLLVALFACAAYVRFIRNDRLAGRMMIVGLIAGGIGFPGGQCIQASHAWNPEMYTDGLLSNYSEYFRYFNWWNMMETTFGIIFGGVVGMGLWMNRRLIQIREDDDVPLWMPIEIVLAVIHVAMILGSEFLELEWLPEGSPFAAVLLYTDYGILMSALPIACIVSGRIWPFLMLLPIVAAPIAGKTIRQLVYNTDIMTPVEGWTLLTMPFFLMLALSIVLIRLQPKHPKRAALFSGISLLACTSFFFALNTLFFESAWPWKEWTARTPNQTIFSVCALALLVGASCSIVRSRRNCSSTSVTMLD